MESVADLVESERLRKLALPSNLRLGAEIAERGGVEIDAFGPLRVSARVAGGVARRVELVSSDRGLGWKCTCTKRPELFCKHLVAVALVTWQRAPARHG